MRGTQSLKKQQSGFTLLELLIVLTIIGLVAPYAAPNYVLRLEERRSDAAVAETAAIYAAAANFRNINSVWPGGVGCVTAINDLTTNNFLANVDTTNIYNQNIVTSCTDREFTVVQTTSVDAGELVSLGLPNTVISNAATGEITSTFPLPGVEPAVDELLDLAGTRVMTGNLQLGGNNITNAGSITATTSANAPRFVDSNNAVYFVDPSGTSNVARLDATTSIETPVLRDSDNIGFFVDPASRSELNTLDVSSVRDQDNTSFTLDPNSISNLNAIETQDLLFTTSETQGTGCTTGSIGVTSTGQLLTCESSVWQLAGGGISVVRSRLADTGFVQYSNGLIMQWGRVSTGGREGIRTINFPLAFPSAVMNIQTSVEYPGGGVADDIWEMVVRARNRIRFSFIMQSNRTCCFRNAIINWYAVGR